MGLTYNTCVNGSLAHGSTFIHTHVSSLIARDGVITQLEIEASPAGLHLAVEATRCEEEKVSEGAGSKDQEG